MGTYVGNLQINHSTKKSGGGGGEHQNREKDVESAKPLTIHGRARGGWDSKTGEVTSILGDRIGKKPLGQKPH